MYDRLFWLGIGCRQGISQQIITREVDRILTKYQIIKTEIIGVATIDLKAKNPSIRSYCQENNFYLQTFSRSELNRVEVPHPATVIMDKIGTHSVAEAAAILAASLNNRRAILVVPKQILSDKEERGVMTIAVARSILDRQIS
jgi:cobalt-precorrin 5A hydrolase